jgi:hypothetical protein
LKDEGRGVRLLSFCDVQLCRGEVEDLVGANRQSPASDEWTSTATLSSDDSTLLNSVYKRVS